MKTMKQNAYDVPQYTKINRKVSGMRCRHELTHDVNIMSNIWTRYSEIDMTAN